MSNPADLLFTKDHEWLDVKEDVVRIGITEYAQDELGDIVFVDLPAVGDELTEGDSAAVVESVKAVSEIYAPVAGTVTAVNTDLEESPELINEAPYSGGWIFEIQIGEGAALKDTLSMEEYETSLKEA